jgi:curved DNA-binding protein CbpA
MSSSDKKAYYQENKDKIIERQKKYNQEHRKPKGKLANKRERIRIQLKRNQKKVEEYKKHLAEINT